MPDARTTRRRRRAAPPPRRRFAISPDLVKAPLGVLGALLIIAGGCYYVIFGGFDTTARIITAAGILLIGVAVAIDPEAIWGKMTSRNMLYGGNTLAVAVIFIGILVLVNVLGARQPQRWDLTANKSFSLSDETLNILSQIPQPIEAVGFFSFDDSRRRDFEDQLYEMKTRSNGMLDYELIDPVVDPVSAQQLGVRELGTTVLIMGDKRQQITGTREADITTGILKLVQPNPRKIYFTTGHQEHRLDSFDPDGYSQLKAQLESRNFMVDSLNLFTQPDVPEDASMVVIAGPKVPFTDAEVQALGAYADRGGDLLVMVDPAVDSGLAPLAAKWGVEIGKTYVVETNPRLVAARSPFLPVVERLANHKVTERANLPTVFLVPTYLSPPQTPPQGFRVTPLAQTSDQSWAETDETALRNPQNVKLDEGVDVKGPLTLALAIEQNPDPAPAPGADAPPSNTPKTRVLMVSTSRLATNEVFQLGANIGNADLFINGSSWLVGDDELISIRPRPTDNRTMFLTSAQRNFIMLSSIFFLPALVLGAGIIVWWSRR